jgi:uncharacterized membrane protein (UPF0127 family)
LKLINASKPESKGIISIKPCNTFIQKWLGLMFIKELGTDEGIVLMEEKESRLSTAIHMLFMNFDITVLWLDKNFAVVDKTLAKKWRPFYMARKPAQYVVELHKNQYNNYAVGDKLLFERK